MSFLSHRCVRYIERDPLYTAHNGGTRNSSLWYLINRFSWDFVDEVMFLFEGNTQHSFVIKLNKTKQDEKVKLDQEL